MPERGSQREWIEPIVARVVAEVLESNAAQLREEIVRRVVEEIAAESPAAEPANATTSSTFAPADLARAVGEIQLGSSQREILRALLDASSRYAARVALFVVKGNHATGWQARGFANSDAVKDFALNESAPAVARAIGDRAVTSAPVADLDARFLREFGSPSSGEGKILPLILKDKVAALVYADGGTEASGMFDAGALELLVLSTSAWLEVNSLRKQAQKEPSAEHLSGHDAASQSVPSTAPASHATPAFNDPFAAHAPAFASHAMAAAAGEASASAAGTAVDSSAIPVEQVATAHSAVVKEQSAVHSAIAESAIIETEPALAEHPPAGHAETTSEAATPKVSSISPEEQEVHRKAQRFARLLVDEIKLYNQAKVAEGRKKKDLYDRLKEAIEKSRATYQKRYGNTVAASGNYFQHEIIRSLAEDNVSIMGPNFRQ